MMRRVFTVQEPASHASLRDDSGIVLVAVMVSIMLITFIATGGYVLASQALTESTKHSAQNRAFQVAASGMDRELASFSTSNFTGNSSGYSRPGSTPDGTYQITVSRDPGASFMFKMTSVGTSGQDRSTVETTFFYMDLWAMSIGAGGTDFGSGAAWNGNSAIYGPMYVKGPVTLNSNAELHYGPLFVSEGGIDFGGGCRFYPLPNQKYKIFAAGPVRRVDTTKTEIYTSCPQLTLPWLDEEYFAGMLERAREESSDNYLGTTDRPSGEVETVGQPSTYIGTRAPNASSQYYKVINGNLTINSTTPSFGKMPTDELAGDDFAFNRDTGTLYVNGVVYVDGTLTIGQGVTGYAGNGIIVATGDVLISNAATFEPITDNRDGFANDLTIENCLGIATEKSVKVHGCVFEGIVFANESLQLRKIGNRDGEFEGIVHTTGIDSETPSNILEMERDFNPAIMPRGMPGSSSDPRGAEYSSQGMLVPGTWVRR